MVGFLGLSCMFALAGVPVFGEFSSWGNLGRQTEPQLKQKPCLFWLQVF